MFLEQTLFQKKRLECTIIIVIEYFCSDDHTKLLFEDMDISVDDERTLTMIQDVDASDVIQESLPVPVQEYGIEAGTCSSQGIVFEGATLQCSGSELPGLVAEQSRKIYLLHCRAL